MFGFIGKFKQEVTLGFTAVQQRLITLEAQVKALLEHTRVTAQADVGKVEQEVAVPVAAAIDKVEEVKKDIGDVQAASAAVATVEADVTKPTNTGE